jgi:hypothetical protein
LDFGAVNEDDSDTPVGVARLVLLEDLVKSMTPTEKTDPVTDPVSLDVSSQLRSSKGWKNLRM